MSEFEFCVSEAEKSYLKQLARSSIASRLGIAVEQPGEPVSEKLKEPFGAFVTLHLHGQLRGCIGSLVPKDALYLTVSSMARAAAFEDPRFMALTAQEFPNIDIEISVMGPITPCPDPERIEVGRHGLIMVRGHAQGLLLPQVPVEWGWDRVTFLEQTCLKAGLPADAWKDPATSMYWFEAVVF